MGSSLLRQYVQMYGNGLAGAIFMGVVADKRIIHLYQEEGCAVLWLHSAAGITGADW